MKETYAKGTLIQRRFYTRAEGDAYLQAFKAENPELKYDVKWEEEGTISTLSIVVTEEAEAEVK